MPEGDPEQSPLGDQDIVDSLGEALAELLDLRKWAPLDGERSIERLRSEIATAVSQEGAIRTTIRRELLAGLSTEEGALPQAGVYRAVEAELRKIQEGLLFPGQVAAVDGTMTAPSLLLPIGVVQLGIAMVNYGGPTATFQQRLFRKEITGRLLDTVKVVAEVVRKRSSRGQSTQGEALTELAQRGIRTLQERRILVEVATSEWRMGQGNPCSYELLTGSGSMGLLHASLDVLGRMIGQHQKFVFVQRRLTDRGLTTVGYALYPGEYVILGTLEEACRRVVEGGHYAKPSEKKAKAFVDEYGPQVLRGLYRASESAPPVAFYAHREHVHLAVRVAMADSILRAERGFPMLLDVAEMTCRSAFGADGFVGLLHEAYARAGGDLRHFGERDLRG